MTMMHEDNAASGADRVQTSAETSDFLQHLGEAVSHNPVAAALIGMGALWLFMGGSKVSLGAATIWSDDESGARSESSGHTTGRAGMAGRKVGGGVSAAASHVSDAISSTYEDASAATSRAADLASRSGAAVSRSVDTAQRDLGDLYERQPLVLGAVGVVIGAAIAAAFPSSGIERRLAGNSSQALKQEAEHLLSEGLESARTAAAEAMGTQAGR